MILSLRDDPMVQNDYNILWLGFEHNNNCNINGTSIVVEQFKRDLIERASLITEFMTYFERQWMDNPSIQKREWNVESLDSYRTNNNQEGNNHRINCRITPSISGNLWTFMKAMMKEQICQSRLLDQFEHGGRFALRRKVYRENEERVEILMYERTNGNLDTMQFLDAMYHRIGE
jgi:hypothetical protein